MPSSVDLFSRRAALRLAVGMPLAAAPLLLLGCAGDMGSGSGLDSAPEPQATLLGTGSVKVALILPLSAAEGIGASALSMRNAAEMALQEFSKANIQLIVLDDAGTAAGARAAARKAVSDGAEIILGPLLAPAVAAASQITRAAGKPMIAFSTDASVATRGVYLMSFMPQSEVARIVAYTASKGRTAFAAAISDTPYGTVAERAFQRAVTARQGRVVALERFAPASGGVEALQRLAPAIGGATPTADSLFLPDGGSLASVAQALQSQAVDMARVKPIGTSQWYSRDSLRLPALQGGWYAAPPMAGFDNFAQRYRKRFNAEPARVASLAYDAVSLVAALERTQGQRRFSEAVLTDPSGFNGADGVFRFNADGTNERAIAVYEVKGGVPELISPAPTSLDKSAS